MANFYGGWEEYSRAGGPTTPAPPTTNWWDKLLTGVKDFGQSDALPIVLGQAAQAVMGGSPEGRQSWQSGLGGVAAGLGQSNIAAKAAKRQATERSKLSKMFTDIISGNVPFTDATKDGLTTAGIKVSPDGTQKVTIDGRGLIGGPTAKENFQIDEPGNEVYAGTQPQTQPQQGSPATQPQASPPKPAGNVRPSAPPMTPQLGSQLPFYLAQAVTGSGGGSGNLFGLSPEQISNISRTDILGQEVLRRGTRDVYSNLGSQAYSNYLAQKPAMEAAKTAAATSLGQAKLGLDASKAAADIAIKQSRLELDNKLAQLTAARTAAANRQDYAAVSKIDQDLRLEMQRAVRDAEVAITGGFDSKGYKIDPPGHGKLTQSMLDNYNSISNSNEYYIMGKDEWGSDKPYDKITLPPGVKAEDMFVTKRNHPELTIDDIIKLLTK